MPEIPHWYVVRGAENEADYVALFDIIREQGVWEKFGKRRYRYLYLGDGWKYWAMTTDVNYSRIINRAKVDGLDDTEDLAGAGLRRVGDDDWSFRSIEREIAPDADKHALAAFAASSAPPKRRERKPTLARGLAVVKAAHQKGLSVRRATIEGVALEFGQPEAEPAFTEIETPEQLRRLI
jgi:hypothetical protein